MGNRTDFCIDLFAFTIRSPAWETAPISVSICSPSQFAHLHGKPPVSVRVITTSVSLTAERPFRLQGTHVIPILFGSQFTVDVRLHDPHRFFFWGRSSNGIAHGRHLSPSFYIYRRASACCRPFEADFSSLLSVGAHEQFLNAITLELRASLLAGGLRFHFFFYVVWSCMVCTVPPLYKRPHLKQYCTTTTPLASKQYST